MSALEDRLWMQMRALGMPLPQREVRWHPQRRWRFDFAWPAAQIAVEVEGGVWVAGRHSRGAGFVADVEKYAEAALAGWLVLRVTAQHIKDGRAVGWIQRAHDLRRAA